MSDTSAVGQESTPTSAPTSAAPATPAAAPVAPVAPVAPDAPAAGDSAGHIDMPDGTKLFPLEYVEKLRNEAAGYRTKLREMESATPTIDPRFEAFAQYEDDDLAVWSDLAKAWIDDPFAAARQMQTISQRVLQSLDDGTASPEGNAAMDTLLDSGETITAEKVAEIVQAEMQRQQVAADMERQVQSIYDEIRTGGVDPMSLEGHMVLWRASNETNGDVAKALELHGQYRQSIIDGYVKSKTPDGTSPMPTPQGTAGAAVVEPMSLDDAFKAGREFLNREAQLR